MQNKIQILSTKKISDSFIQLAAENNICIDQLSFIETEESVSEEIKNSIPELSKQHITAVFTSSNAVSAVGKMFPRLQKFAMLYPVYFLQRNSLQRLG